MTISLVFTNNFFSLDDGVLVALCYIKAVAKPIIDLGFVICSILIKSVDLVISVIYSVFKSIDLGISVIYSVFKFVSLGISLVYSILIAGVNIVGNIISIANELYISYILIYIFIRFNIFILMMNTSDNEVEDYNKEVEDYNNKVNFDEWIDFPDSSDDDKDNDENSKKRKHEGDENSKKREHIGDNKGDENSREEESFEIITIKCKNYKSKGNKTLLNIFKNSKSSFFKEYVPTKKKWYQKMDGDEITIFNNSIDTVLKNRAYINVNLYKTMYDIREPRKYLTLLNGFKRVYANNSHLKLDWREQCRIYAILHHKATSFDIKDIETWTPETFFTFLQTGKVNKTLDQRWVYMANKYLLNPEKKYELYTYMRIAYRAIDEPQRYLTKLRMDYIKKYVIKFILDALNKK